MMKHAREGAAPHAEAAMQHVWMVLLIAAIGLQAGASPAQQPDASSILRRLDAAAQYRYDNVLGFTDVEHYAIFRGDDETHPAAEMTVKTTYRRGQGKTYDILSESGSSFLLKVGLHPLLDNEKDINVPGHVQLSWFTTANYDMKLKSPATRRMNGRDCYVLEVAARRKATNMINGTLWADAQNGLVMRIEGIATKSPSVFSGAPHMMRDYTVLDGFSMSTHARAESNGALIGRTVVTIDYGEYHLQIRGAK
jgi:negative regulator of sigma E activity